MNPVIKALTKHWRDTVKVETTGTTDHDGRDVYLVVGEVDTVRAVYKDQPLYVGALDLHPFPVINRGGLWAFRVVVIGMI